MSREQLIDVLPRPKKVVETGQPEQWPTIEATLGVVLPDDYKAYINRFGTGLVCNFVYVLNPFSRWEKLNLLEAITKRLPLLQNARAESPSGISPFRPYPEPGGLLPWGTTENGDGLYWITEGAPDMWSIVINEVRSENFEAFSGPMTSFLYDLVTRRIDSEILSDLLSKKITFRPI